MTPIGGRHAPGVRITVFALDIDFPGEVDAVCDQYRNAAAGYYWVTDRPAASAYAKPFYVEVLR